MPRNQPRSDETPASRWKGDEVEGQAEGEAEQAADRAEGNEPIRADPEAERSRAAPTDDPSAAPRPGRPASSSSSDDGGDDDSGDNDDDADEKTRTAAEEHRLRRGADRPPRGRL